MAGPKTVQYDGKVPEGCYRLTFQNQWSTFYLGYLLSYPNRSGQLRRVHWNTGDNSGGAIVLHGSRASIGCIPVGDPAIEEIFLLLNKNWNQAGNPVKIHVFPCRFDVAENEKVLADYEEIRTELTDFWNTLRPVYRFFETHGRLPAVSHDRTTGYYVLGQR